MPRFTADWPGFDDSPWRIDLTWAEKPFMNGTGCPGDQNYNPDNAHGWSLPTYGPDRREGAIFFSRWPTCENGSPHPDWDGVLDGSWPPQPDPFERLKHLYESYICKGFCFWQGDLAAQSGAAERFFGFGKIQPAGDFDGDGDNDGVDWQHWQNQYWPWLQRQTLGGLGPNDRLTYYHGDMDSNGVLDVADLLLAQDAIRDGNLGQNPYWLGDSAHKMNWDPNVKWLPCPDGGTSSGALFGGPP